jgi:hypothetical protein
MHTATTGFCFINVFTLMTCAFTLMTLSRLSLILTWREFVRMAMLSKQDQVEWLVPLTRFQDCDPFWLEWLVLKLISDVNLRLGEETMGRQVEYYWMGRVRVDKKIFEAPWCLPSSTLVKDRSSGPVSKFELCTSAYVIYGVP